MLRAPTGADHAAALAVVVARDVAATGAPDFTLSDLREEWSEADFDPALDAVLAELQGEVVGVAWLRDGEVYAGTHPAAEGRGVGSELLAWAEARTAQRGRPLHRQHAAPGGGGALLEGAGYHYVRSYWRMQIELGDAAGAPDWPAGTTVRALDRPADAEALHEVSETAFVTVPDYEPQDLGAFRHEFFDRHDVAAGLSVVAEDGDGACAFAITSRWPEEAMGYVKLLAVHPRAGRRGLGTALLREVFVRVRAADLGRAALGVAGDNPSALRLYERAGMSRVSQADRWEKPVA